MTPAAARLFVALDLPAAAVDALLAWRTPLLGENQARSVLRPVPPEALHVTLCFLGQRSVDAIGPIGELVAAQAAHAGGVAGLALGAPLWLPRRRPRVLAVALEDHHGVLGALQLRLAAELAAGGWYEPESRPYLPHVTVARVRGGEGSSRASLGAPPQTTFEGAAVTLYRSHLGSAGPRYEALVRAPLA